MRSVLLVVARRLLHFFGHCPCPLSRHCHSARLDSPKFSLDPPLVKCIRTPAAPADVGVTRHLRPFFATLARGPSHNHHARTPPCHRSFCWPLRCHSIGLRQPRTSQRSLRQLSIAVYRAVGLQAESRQGTLNDPTTARQNACALRVDTKIYRYD